MNVELEARLRRLMLFRVVMVTTLQFIATYVEVFFSETLLAVNPLYFVIVATYVLTVVYALALRFLSRWNAQVHVQLVGDLLTITALVYVFGGMRTGFLLSGFLLLYPLSVLSATVLVPRRAAVSLAGLATVLYGSLLLAVRSSLTTPQGLADAGLLPPRPAIYSIFVLGVACVTAALLGSYLAESLQHAGIRLQEAAVEVADLRELNQVIVSSIQSGLATTDAQGRVLYVNAFGEGILGRGLSVLRGTSVSDARGSSLLGLAELRVRAASRALGRLELSYAHPAGSRLELGVSVAPLAAGAGAQGGYLLVFQDLTEVRRLEDEVRTKEKLAAVGAMAAELAHEIRNPLGSIVMAAKQLGGAKLGKADREMVFRVLQDESQRLNETLTNFLAFARPRELKLERADLNALVEDVCGTLRSNEDFMREVALAVELDPGLKPFPFDRDQVRQVVWNIALNAVQAMDGHGKLTVSTGRDPGASWLRIRDTGPGLPDSIRATLFKPFQTTKQHGTGLGLAIAQRIVKAHGGAIALDDQPGLGAQFTIRLPYLQ